MEQLTFDQYIADNFTLCACGCGVPTPPARYTDRRSGLVKGQPTRYIKGHTRRLRIDETGRQCGACREYKPWGEFHTSRTTRYGHVTTCKPCMAESASAAWRNGGHAQRVAKTWQSVRLCECGCGQPTRISEHTDLRYGYVKGQPVRYLRSHWKRGKVFSDPERRRQARIARSRAYYAANRGRLGEYARAWRLATGYQRPAGTNFKSNYGITYADYSRMVIAQCGACSICGSVPSEDPDAHKKVNKLFVDHDHETGQVRDLLCQMCNLMLGQADDNAVRLRDGAAYLEEWRKGNEPEMSL